MNFIKEMVNKTEIITVNINSDFSAVNLMLLH